jgi:hypothetical protein
MTARSIRSFGWRLAEGSTACLLHDSTPPVRALVD